MAACVRNIWTFSVNDTDVNKTWTHVISDPYAKPGNVLLLQLAVMSKGDISAISCTGLNNDRFVSTGGGSDYVALFGGTKTATGTSADNFAITVSAGSDVFAYYAVVYELKLDGIGRCLHDNDVDTTPDTSCLFKGWGDLKVGDPTNIFGGFLASTYVDAMSDPPASLTTNVAGMTIVGDTTLDTGSDYFQIRAGYLDPGDLTYQDGLSDFSDTLSADGESLTLTHGISGIYKNDSPGMMQFSF